MEERNIEKEINYDEIKRMEEHAKKYEDEFDKKNFLRNISAYEQKIILLNSKKPYEVLNYLDELDLKNSRQILSELSFDEVRQILDLFTAEDKQKFYRTYSDFSLVNQFIMHDKSSSKYIKDLTFDRKVDLIDSSNKDTVMASAKIYETMPEEERNVVSDAVTSSTSISSLSEAVDYVERNEINNDVIGVNLNENESNELDDLDENKSIELEDINKEIIEEMLDLAKVEEQEENKEENIEKVTEEELIDEEKEEVVAEEGYININDENNNDNLIISDIEDSVNSESLNTPLEEFQIAKQQTEQQEIEIIKQNIAFRDVEHEMNNEIQHENIKTL